MKRLFAILVLLVAIHYANQGIDRLSRIADAIESQNKPQPVLSCPPSAPRRIPGERFT